MNADTIAIASTVIIGVRASSSIAIAIASSIVVSSVASNIAVANTSSVANNIMCEISSRNISNAVTTGSNSVTTIAIASSIAVAACNVASSTGSIGATCSGV